MNRQIDCEDFDFQFELLDVQELNSAMSAGQFDVCKVSFYAALSHLDKISIFDSGAALGFGVGPLLLSAIPATSPDNWQGEGEPLVLTPGQHTTAAMLYRAFYGCGDVKHVVFSEIMPALQNGTADFGICIHEGRFTWQQHGLSLVEDLGLRWENTTGLPLPLGGIVGRKSLGPQTLIRMQKVIRRSIEFGLAHRDQTVPTMRKYAQELSDDVLFAHVDLYVNDWTVHLGQQGRAALKYMLNKCREFDPQLFNNDQMEIIGN